MMRHGFRASALWIIAVVALLGGVALVFSAREGADSNPDLLASQARDALRYGQWSRAETLLDRLSRQRAPLSGDRLLRASLEESRGRPDDALKTLAAVPDSDPLAPQARLGAAQIERKRNRMQRAEGLLLEALRLDPKLISARRELVYLYGMQCSRVELSAQFQALSELAPLNVDDVFLWSSTQGDIWINIGIRPELERYLAADPDDRRSRLALAEVLLRASLLDDAERTLQPLPASDDEARVLRARIALNRGRLEEARATLAGGSAEHPGLALVRGQIAMRSNNPAEAVRQFRIAVSRDPMNLEAMQSLALALTRLNRKPEAAQVQKRADKLRDLVDLLQRANTTNGRKDPTIPGRLGRLCEELEQPRLARAWYKVAISIDPLNSEVQRALYWLDRKAPSEGNPAHS